MNAWHSKIVNNDVVIFYWWTFADVCETTCEIRWAFKASKRFGDLKRRWLNRIVAEKRLTTELECHFRVDFIWNAYDTEMLHFATRRVRCQNQEGQWSCRGGRSQRYLRNENPSSGEALQLWGEWQSTRMFAVFMRLPRSRERSVRTKWQWGCRFVERKWKCLVWIAILIRTQEFSSTPLEPAYFESKPLVLLFGEYSTGKTSFIRYILGKEYPGMRIGPEPTTDNFIVVEYGEEEGIIPGELWLTFAIWSSRIVSQGQEIIAFENHHSSSDQWWFPVMTSPSLDEAKSIARMESHGWWVGGGLRRLSANRTVWRTVRCSLQAMQLLSTKISSLEP